MAAVKVTITGVICDLYGRTISGPVKIVGEAVRTGVGVGGGPIIPGDGPPEGGDGDHIWGPTDPRPTPPIANVPGAPGYRPPSGAHPEHPIYWPPGTQPHPEHPIVVPPVPPEYPNPPEGGAGKPPPPDGGWGYHPDYGWGFFPGTGGQPGPKA